MTVFSRFGYLFCLKHMDDLIFFSFKKADQTIQNDRMKVDVAFVFVYGLRHGCNFAKIGLTKIDVNHLKNYQPITIITKTQIWMRWNSKKSSL